MDAWTKVVIELHKRSLVAMYCDCLHEAGKIFAIHHLSHVGEAPRCYKGSGGVLGRLNVSPAVRGGRPRFNDTALAASYALWIVSSSSKHSMICTPEKYPSRSIEQ